MSYLLGSYGEKSLELIVPVTVGKPGKSRKVSQKAKPRGLPYKALIDTGATASCISPKIIKEIKLKSASSETVVTASGQTSLEIYLFSLSLLLTETMDSKDGIIKQITYPSQLIRGYGIPIGKHSTYDVVLGMDVISRGSLKLDPDGHFSFCL